MRMHSLISATLANHSNWGGEYCIGIQISFGKYFHDSDMIWWQSRQKINNQLHVVWATCIIYCLLFIFQACSNKWLCNSWRKDTLLMMTKLFARSASLSRRLLNSGHLLHFLCCTICTMHLLQIFRPKLPIIEPQLQLFPFLAADCHYHCSNLSYSLSPHNRKYHHQMQEWRWPCSIVRLS